MNSVELFLHGAGRPVVIEAQSSDVLHDVLAKHDALPREGEFVYVGEVRHAKDDPDPEHDEHAPADLALILVDLAATEARSAPTEVRQRRSCPIHGCH